MPLDNCEVPIDYTTLDWSPLPALSNETIWAILEEKLTDAQVNRLLWQYLGYQYDPVTQTWDRQQVDSSWQEIYPIPPDFIASRPATVKLTRSIPPENKQLLKEYLGFTGYKIGEFGPRQTRRATAASWLLSYMQIHNLLLGS
jgi:hypothetical protein